MLTQGPKQAVIWDLCQTLFDTTHRLKYILGEPKNWPEFHKRTPWDTPIMTSSMIFRALNGAGENQIIVTGRNDITRQMNEELLARHGIFHDGLYMRPQECRLDGAELKLKILQQIRAEGKWNPVLAFEDEPRSVAMYRENGVACFAADDRNWRTGKFQEVHLK